jgi:hypothetical protein
MTIPVLLQVKNAAAPLNGLSPPRSNPRLGFDSMKIGASTRICSGSTQNAPPHCRDVNPAAAARRSLSRDFLRREAHRRRKNTPKTHNSCG